MSCRRSVLGIVSFSKRYVASSVIADVFESHVRNGYVEESILPRLYREAPLNSIWEGSGNVNALDVLRAMQREPDSLSAYFGEVTSAPNDARLSRAVEELKREIADPDAESRAAGLVE